MVIAHIKRQRDTRYCTLSVAPRSLIISVLFPKEKTLQHYFAIQNAIVYNEVIEHLMLSKKGCKFELVTFDQFSLVYEWFFKWMGNICIFNCLHVNWRINAFNLKLSCCSFPFVPHDIRPGESFLGFRLFNSFTKQHLDTHI